MSRWTRFRDKVTGAVEAVVSAPIDAAENVAKVAVGKKDIDDGVKDSLRIPVRTFKSQVEVVAEVDRLAQELTVKIAQKIGGEKVSSVVADLNYLARTAADPALGVAALESVDKFIETGDFEYLSPINIYALREIQSIRERILEISRPIAAEVMAALPEEVQGYAGGVRWCLENEIPGELHLPSYAIDHGNHAGAITLIDVIVFEKEPGHETDDDKFLWCHELLHTKQYRDMGTAEFTRRYIGNELGYSTGPGNPLELEADNFACRFFPNAKPHYLPSGVCPIAP